MIPVVYPEAQFKTKQEGQKTLVFEAIRKTWLVLTQEEWVRQNFVHYMIKELAYPSTLIALEKEIYLGELKKRFDILVYDSRHQPWMLIECKAPDIALSENAVHQVLRYHITLPVPFIIITNGHTTYGWEKKSTEITEMMAMPVWKDC